jgi:hypothetical protein
MPPKDKGRRMAAAGKWQLKGSFGHWGHRQGPSSTDSNGMNEYSMRPIECWNRVDGLCVPLAHPSSSNNHQAIFLYNSRIFRVPSNSSIHPSFFISFHSFLFLIHNFIELICL